MSEFGHAIEDYDEAIKLFPANARGYLLRGIVYLDKREYDRAIEDFDQSIKFNPSARPASIPGASPTI